MARERSLYRDATGNFFLLQFKKITCTRDSACVGLKRALFQLKKGSEPSPARTSTGISDFGSLWNPFKANVPHAKWFMKRYR